VICVVLSKNGSEQGVFENRSGGGFTPASGADFFDMNGSRDDLQMWILHNHGPSRDFIGDSRVEGLKFGAARVYP
jgi:hypothetical protein